MSTIKLAGIKLSDMKLQTHEKYGDSYVLENPTVELEGKLYKINTFKTFTKEVVQTTSGPKEVNITVSHLSLREIKASVPKTVEKATPKKDKTPATEADFAQFLAWKAAQAK